MGWMMDEYSIIKRQFSPAVITGKPLPLGGSASAGPTPPAAARTTASRNWNSKRGWDPGDITVAVQGFGNAGQAVAKLLHADGYRIVAVSDSKGGIYSKSGFDIPSLIQFQE
jgi:glutamate dehydrogenase (NADP+)